MSFHVPEDLRASHRFDPTNEAKGTNNGFFEKVVNRKKGRTLVIRMIASDGEGWEHVSVSFNRDRCPTWDEMCWVKDLFWDPEDTVIQYHPPETEYVNEHSYCLHLWRPTEENIPLPPAWMVGFKTKELPHE